MIVLIAILFSSPSLVRAAGRNQQALETRDLCLSPISYPLSAISYQLPAISYQLPAISYFFTAIAARCQADPAEERAWLEYLAAGGKRPEIILASQPENLPLVSITASLFPEDPVVYYQLAELLDQNGEKARALQAYWRVAALSPRDGRAWVRLGRLYEAQADWQTALIYFDRGCLLYDTGGNGCPNAGRLYLAHGFPAEAERSYRQSVIKHPQLEASILGLANSLYLQNRPEEARLVLQPLADAGNQKALELIQQYQSSSNP